MVLQMRPRELLRASLDFPLLGWRLQVLCLDEVYIRILQRPEAEDLWVEETRFFVLWWFVFAILASNGNVDRVLYIRLEDVRRLKLVMGRHPLLIVGTPLGLAHLAALGLVSTNAACFQIRHVLV